MNYALITPQLALDAAFATQAVWSNTPHYVIASYPGPNSTPSMPLPSIIQSCSGPIDNMIFGKKIGSGDIMVVVAAAPWTSGAAMVQYDDTQNMTGQNWYATINAGAWYHTWAVLDNGANATTTVSPTVADLVSGADSYRTADGYLWRYLYSVDSANVARFATTSWFPYLANTTVQNAAIPGALESYIVSYGGQGYGNYLLGTLGPGDARVNGNNLLYSVGDNSTTAASLIQDYYDGCILHLTSGTGAGQWQSVTGYIVNGNGCFAVIAQPFPVPPTNGTGWEMWPGLNITGDGTGAAAMALVNSASGNSIWRIQTLDVGAGYSLASATVQANTVALSPTIATIRPVTSPQGGHGANAAAALGATALSVAIEFDGLETNTIPVNTSYSQVSVLSGALYQDIVISLSGLSGAFGAEPIMYVSRTLPGPNLSLSAGNSIATGTTSTLLNGDWLYMQGQSSYQLAQVQAIANSTQLTLSSPALFSCTATLTSFATVTSAGNCQSIVNSTAIQLTSVPVALSANALLVGLDTGATGTVVSSYRSNQAKGYSTIIGAWRLDGAMTGNLQLYETITQQLPSGAIGASGILAATSNSNATIYLTSITGALTSNGLCTGTTSGATFLPTTKYLPEIVPGSGSVSYIENIASVSRSNTQGEMVNIVVQF